MTSELFPAPSGVAPNDPILTLPKVSLHDHLDGGLRPATIVELAAEIGHELPASDPEALRAWYFEAGSSGNLVQYLETFEHTIAVMQTAEALTRVAREWVLDQVADGVIYAEARWAPEQHLAGGLDLDATVESVQAGLDEGVSIAAQEGKSIRVGQLITAMRQADNHMAIAELALRHRDKGVVGFDIAGPEDGFSPIRQLDAFDYLHRANFPVTIHAGEAAGVQSIFEAVQICHTQRIGHGARITEDIDASDADDVQLGRLASWILDHQITLEQAPTSNVQTGICSSVGEHPITLLKSLGFAVTINPDNRLVSDTSITREMRKLVDEAGWDLGDLEWVTLNALGSGFIPADVRERLIDEQLIPGYEGAEL